MEDKMRILYDPKKANYEMREKINNEMLVSRDKGIIAAYKYVTTVRKKNNYYEDQGKRKGILSALLRNLHFLVATTVVIMVYAM